MHGRDAVAVISTSLWQRWFGGDPGVLGRAITINGIAFKIVGMAPEEFHGVIAGAPANDLWIPAMMLQTGYRWCNAFDYDCAPLEVIARPPRGRSLEQAQAELSIIIAAADAEHAAD